MGLIGSANQTQAMLEIAPAHAGTAGGVLQTTQRIATAIGNAMITAALFIGRGSGQTQSDWFNGFTSALSIVLVALAIASIVAFIYMRKYPHAGPDLAAKARA